ncbi:MAG TPA: hypothetical protein VMK12_11145 [Anaeromyxobacteraceae bacterium]|nr:hypothetical protein [Anaeromyxobacteraceae bacterium]
MTTKVTCPKCRLDELALGDRNPSCKNCGYAGAVSAVAEAYVQEFLGRKRGEGEWPISPCPECSQPTLVAQVEEVGCPAFVCFGCAVTFEEDDLTRETGGRWVKV